MDIFTVVVVFLVLETAICGVCWFVCRERHTPGDIEKHPKRTSHYSALHPQGSAHGGDHQKAWSHTIDQQPNGKDNNVRLTFFPPHILP
jgi:hypothetical protein